MDAWEEIWDNLEAFITQLVTSSGFGVVTKCVDKPQVCGTAVVKRDLARLRLLLPANLRHWMHESVALYHVENAVFSSDRAFALNEDSWSALVRVTTWLADVMKPQATKLCTDFKDFNILHSFANMKSWWTHLWEALTGLHAPSEQGTALDWVLNAMVWVTEALSDVSCTSANKEKAYKLVRGLWSTWRSTSFLNSVMKYSEEHAESCKRMLDSTRLPPSVIRVTRQRRVGHKPCSMSRVVSPEKDSRRFIIYPLVSSSGEIFEVIGALYY
ncbi:hypothetical protein FOZ63_004197 [Perkinsus olseni]|uniref:Uncharacterized protein n=1 Tax=Perkinsus olseni TaxID=32597 RepID=A0A7J6SI80_PEROL|nr:hypothetical protein FOZ63_004197 [Perkinsus olseni]